MTRLITEFRTTCRTDMENRLKAAVEAAHGDQLTDRTGGVLVTRHDFGHFSVAISPEIPYGLVYEKDLVGSATALAQ
jgi:hypothetical protein